MPRCMVVEWNNYLNYEISQWVQAICGAVPTLNKISENTDYPIISDPEAKAKVFDKLAIIGKKHG